MLRAGIVLKKLSDGFLKRDFFFHFSIFRYLAPKFHFWAQKGFLKEIPTVLKIRNFAQISSKIDQIADFKNLSVLFCQKTLFEFFGIFENPFLTDFVIFGTIPCRTKYALSQKANFVPRYKQIQKLKKFQISSQQLQLVQSMIKKLF